MPTALRDAQLEARKQVVNRGTAKAQGFRDEGAARAKAEANAAAKAAAKAEANAEAKAKAEANAAANAAAPANAFQGFYDKLRVLGPKTPTGAFVMGALLIGIGVAIVICIADAMYPFLPSNPFGGPSAAARAGKRFWTSVNKDDENLIVPAKLSPTTSASMYSMSVQLTLDDTRNVGMFRHILHRGSNMCDLPTTAVGSTGHAGIRPEDMSGGGTGLPALMNPGIMLDRYKNDIHVFVHTKGQGADGQEIWLESLTIVDMPIGTPITIGISCNGRALDVYLNCKLYSSLLLRGSPVKLSAETSNWFGRSCAYPVTGTVHNLELWGDALGPSDYSKVCKTKD